MGCLHTRIIVEEFQRCGGYRAFIDFFFVSISREGIKK